MRFHAAAAGALAAACACCACARFGSALRTAHANIQNAVNSRARARTPPALIRLQHIPLDNLYAVVAPHPRLQSAAVKQTLIDTFAYHALTPELTAGAVVAQPPRRYSVVDPRTVHVGAVLRVRDGEERVRHLCDTLPSDNPIKFVAKMKQTIGVRGVLVAKSRRGSLKLRFDNLDLAEDKREFWYPAEALTW